MKATLEPIEGNYDGTCIKVTYNDGFSPEFLSIKCEGHGEPSRRQLRLWNITLEQWNNNQVVKTMSGKLVRIKETFQGLKPYETKESFLRAIATINKINDVKINT